MVFQGVRKLIRRPCQSAIRGPISCLRKSRFSVWPWGGAVSSNWSDANRRARLLDVAGPRDAAGIDVENFARRAEFSERRGVGAGHPDLGAEFFQFNEQGVAPCGIEMRYHLVEQQ